MEKIKGNIRAIYEVNSYGSYKTQRFMIEDSNSNKVFLTLWNNQYLLTNFKVNDFVECSYSTKEKTKENKTYINHYCYKIVNGNPLADISHYAKGKFTTSFSRNDYYHLKVDLGISVKTNLTVEDFINVHKQLGYDDYTFRACIKQIGVRYKDDKMLIIGNAKFLALYIEESHALLYS